MEGSEAKEEVLDEEGDEVMHLSNAIIMEYSGITKETSHTCSAHACTVQ